MLASEAARDRGDDDKPTWLVIVIVNLWVQTEADEATTSLHGLLSLSWRQTRRRRAYAACRCCHGEL